MSSHESPQFHLFPLLPPELRILIWEEALDYECKNQPLLIQLFSATILLQKNSASSIIRACRESRALMDTFYPTVFNVHMPPHPDLDRLSRKKRGRVRINFERATLVDISRIYELDAMQWMQTGVVRPQHGQLARNTLTVDSWRTVNWEVPEIYPYGNLVSRRKVLDTDVAFGRKQDERHLYGIVRKILDNIKPETPGALRISDALAGQVRVKGKMLLCGGRLISLGSIGRRLKQQPTEEKSLEK